jgi:hypothetical protein
MIGCMEVFRGVLILRVVATANMTASQTEPEVNPNVACFKTFLASFGCFWLDILWGLRQVCAW